MRHEDNEGHLSIMVNLTKLKKNSSLIPPHIQPDGRLRQLYHRSVCFCQAFSFTLVHDN